MKNAALFRQEALGLCSSMDQFELTTIGLPQLEPLASDALAGTHTCRRGCLGYVEVEGAMAAGTNPFLVKHFSHELSRAERQKRASPRSFPACRFSCLLMHPVFCPALTNAALASQVKRLLEIFSGSRSINKSLIARRSCLV